MTQAIFTPVIEAQSEYTAHAGQVVEVLRPIATDDTGLVVWERMFKIRASDGWEGDAFESELQTLQGDQ